MKTNSAQMLYQIIVVLLLSSCNSNSTLNDADNSKNKNTKADTVGNLPIKQDNIQHLLTDYFQEFKVQPQLFIINPSLGSQTINGKRGMKIMINPADLELEDGRIPTGKIELSLTELHKQADFVLNNTPTTSDGRFLISGGACHIECSAMGKKLKIKSGKMITVYFPKTTKVKMQLFQGAIDSQKTINWKETNKKFTAIKDTDQDSILVSFPTLKNKYRDSILAEMGPKTSIDISKYKVGPTRMKDINGKTYLVAKVYVSTDTEWTQRRVSANFRSEELAAKALGVDYNVIQLTNFGWVNCDRFPNTPLTNVDYSIKNMESPTRAWLIFKTLNSAIVQYNINASGSFKSIPIEQPVKLIVMGWKDGKIIASVREFTTQENQQIDIEEFKPVEKKLLLQKIGITII